MKTIPAITVITTVYNGEQHVQRAIESIRGQTEQDWEYVIVDDGSTDGTWEILERAASADPRIRPVTQGRLGRARALNLAWRTGSGALIANLDADDYALPERLAHQRAFMEQHPEVGVVGSLCGTAFEDNVVVGKLQKPQSDAEIRRMLTRKSPVVHSSAMIRREVLEAVDGYSETFAVAIDYDLWVRLAELTQLANIGEVLVIRQMSGQRYFRFKISTYRRTVSIVNIRWRAWKRFSRRPGDLKYVLWSPIRDSLKITSNILRDRRRFTASPERRP